MKRFHPVVLLIVLLGLGWLGQVRTGCASEAPGSRFAFADTTLLRDTLELHFDRLFPLADSLRILPDTLRALSVRYQLSIEHLVSLADSMRVPVDSVGVILERARFNPLVSTLATSNDFRYTSSYTVGQTNHTWVNGSDYNLVRGPLFLHSVISISLGEYRAGGLTSQRETRGLTTELGWRLSKDLSLGGRANLQRFANLDRSIYSVTDNSNEFQFSVRSKHDESHGLSSELNFFSGLLDQSKSNGGKRGISGDLNGRMIYSRGAWLSQDMDGQVTGNLAHTTPPGSPGALDTRDLSANLRGNVALFEAAPVGFNMNYGLRYSRVENPVAQPTPGIQPVQTNSRDLALAMRLRRDTDRYLNLDVRLGESQNSTASGLGAIGSASTLTTGGDRGFGADGRYALFGFTLDARFSYGRSTTRSPRRTVVVIDPTLSDTVDYRELQLQRTRSVEATLTRVVSRRLTARANGSVGLDSYDYSVDATLAQPTYPRDQYHQSYRIEALYTPSDRFNSGASFEVARTVYLNLTSASSAGNSENDSYRAEWRWNARLFPGFTATQRNNVVASYDYQIFQRDLDKLSLDYSTVTSLNAVLTPRLTIDINHNARYQPRGGYNAIQDGPRYFTPGDESRSYVLSVRIAYTPVPALSLSLSPDYQQFDRATRTGEGTVPQSRQRTLNFSGGANLNLKVGGSGRLTGNIQRTYNSSRSITFATGASGTPRSQIDYWDGSLQFSWSL